MAIALAFLPPTNPKAILFWLAILFCLLAFSASLVIHYFWHRCRAILVGILVAGLLSVGFGWYVWPISSGAMKMNTPENPTDVLTYPPFELIAQHYELGKALAAEEKLAQAYQGEYKGVPVIWNDQTTEFYWRDRNTNTWESHSDTVDNDPKWFDDDYVRKLLHIPEGSDPPYGGVARLSAEDENIWRKIGVRLWHCQYNWVSYQQRFQHGFIIGPFILSSTLPNVARAFVVRNDKQWATEKLSGAPAPCEPPPKATARLLPRGNSSN